MYWNQDRLNKLNWYLYFLFPVFKLNFYQNHWGQYLSKAFIDSTLLDENQLNPEMAGFDQYNWVLTADQGNVTILFDISWISTSIYSKLAAFIPLVMSWMTVFDKHKGIQC